ncbi:unnamed protein product [Euphydryas editha]|uniref:Gag-like protein n=1 Tax=Euphydryas editha TaxID=104508 RepID=A0AAU9V264_EUPED|nr:unnamed protein product [Euphydryas editha]
MDMVTGVANDLLQRGKEALESAEKMKRETKITVYESLQGLYETVLSLSDSRSRHICNLEKERTRHAQELLRVERAHAKELTDLRKTLLSSMQKTQEDVAEALREARAIHTWLDYDTVEPFRRIRDILEKQIELNEKLSEIREAVSSARTSSDKTAPTDNTVQESLKAVGNRLSSLFSGIEKLKDEVTETRAHLIAKIDNIPLVSDDVCRPITLDTGIEKHIIEIKEQIKQINSEPYAPQVHPQQDLTPVIETFNEKLEIMSSELRTLRDSARAVASPNKPSLETEMAVQEVKQTLNTIKEGVTKLAPRAPNTYAQVTARPKSESVDKRPNHTLIISSRNPQETSEQVLTKIKDSLDLKKSGAKMERVRKARDQKIVVRCASKEDMAKIRGQVQKNAELTVREPTNQDPLVCVRGVLNCYSNEEIADLIKAQNDHIFEGVDKAALKMKVRYRKRARNPHECHPVIELSPVLWRRFVDKGKLYVGFGRCVVEDQSPLVQCMRCLGFGHTKALCKQGKESCNFCAGEHVGGNCPSKAKGDSPKCINCLRAKRSGPDLAHTAYSSECQERIKWDGIARSRVQYC